MIRLLCFVLAVLTSPFKSKLRLEAENAVLRHQLIVLRRRLHGRVRLTNGDRWFLVQLYRWFPPILKVLTIIRPETLVRWHRAGFLCYWCWKSRRRGGRPQIDTELRALIRLMSTENSFWGAPRIHGELLKLGFEVAQSSVAKYMVKRRGPPSQGWRAFLRNHAQDIAAMDLFVVPTIGFDLLYAYIIARLDRRELVWISVTTNPTAEWVARGASASDSEILCPLLQRRQNASLFEQGCSSLSVGTAHRCHWFDRHPWRTSSLLWSDLGFRYTQLGLHHQTFQRCVERAVAEGPMAALDDRPRPWPGAFDHESERDRLCRKVRSAFPERSFSNNNLKRDGDSRLKAIAL
jgi:hypothetical protein